MISRGPARFALRVTEKDATILSVRGLETRFRTSEGVANAVNGVCFDLRKGETLGIVGESGSGKSAMGMSLMRLISPPGRIDGGEIIFDGKDILKLSDEEVRKLRGRRVAMVFQDPMASLNPYLPISVQLTEITRLHLGHSRKEARAHAIEMLKLVGIPDPDARIDDHPHEFSGGMRQRAMIAMALSCGPELLIADEPTTALDVTIQAQILELIEDLKQRSGTSVILITHDLGVVAGTTDRVIVMYAGRIFEQALTTQLFAHPANPYTQALLKSMPDLSLGRGEPLYQIKGMPPETGDLPPGCPFSPRCERAENICGTEPPPFVMIDQEHGSLCHFAGEMI